MKEKGSGDFNGGDAPSYREGYSSSLIHLFSLLGHSLSFWPLGTHALSSVAPLPLPPHPFSFLVAAARRGYHAEVWATPVGASCVPHCARVVRVTTAC